MKTKKGRRHGTGRTSRTRDVGRNILVFNRSMQYHMEGRTKILYPSTDSKGTKFQIGIVGVGVGSPSGESE